MAIRIFEPHIDRLADEGIRFSNAYCVNSVCSPSRATFMTGLIPSQHGVHCYLGGERPDAQMGPDAYCTIREFANLPRVMADAGYVCGLSGKWHLGDSLRPQEGFSYWFTRPRGHTTTFYDDELIWRNGVYTEPRYTTEVITEHALEFLRQNHHQPFFLYVAYNGPMDLGQECMLETPSFNQHTELLRQIRNCRVSRPGTSTILASTTDRTMIQQPGEHSRICRLPFEPGVDDGVCEPNKRLYKGIHVTDWQRDDSDNLSF